VTILLCVLAIWRFSVGSLSVSNIRTFRVEVFYRMAILFSNMLGTALGDSWPTVRAWDSPVARF
jgi:uncharacterized membrane-anchored protein